MASKELVMLDETDEEVTDNQIAVVINVEKRSVKKNTLCILLEHFMYGCAETDARLFLVMGRQSGVDHDL